MLLKTSCQLSCTLFHSCALFYCCTLISNSCFQSSLLTFFNLDGSWRARHGHEWFRHGSSIARCTSYHVSYICKHEHQPAGWIVWCSNVDKCSHHHTRTASGNNVLCTTQSYFMYFALPFFFSVVYGHSLLLGTIYHGTLNNSIIYQAKDKGITAVWCSGSVLGP